LIRVDAKTGRGALTIALSGVVSLTTVAALLTRGSVEAFATWSLVAVLVVAATMIWLTSVRRRRSDRALRKALTSLRRNATRDPTTGLPNRIGLIDDIRYRLAADPEGSLALIVIDVDRFQSLTRLVGPDRAEDLLETVGSRLRSVAGRTDAVARITGDVFAVLTSDAAPDQVGRRCRILLDEVATPMRVSDMDIALTACAGWITTRDAPEPEELIELATATCETAKTKGRNHQCAFTPEIAERSHERRALTDQLRVAQHQGQFETYFQPIVELSTGRLAGGEALLRWHHPVRGLIEARRWVDLADEIGLLADLGRANIAQCCRHFVALNAARVESPIQLAVNLSPAELRSPGLAAAIAEATSDAGLSPDLLVVELGLAALSDDHTMDVLAAIREVGVHISLDHFGSGIAPLDRVKAAGVDRVKLDSEIVHAVTDQTASSQVLRALVDLAHGMGLSVVAEGLLTEPQRDRISTAGCEFGQGFLYGRPLPFSRFAELAGERIREPLSVG
jgi:diguanylate cyclase (GGDEF)-like protein